LPTNFYFNIDYEMYDEDDDKEYSINMEALEEALKDEVTS
jgi:hypothetical protein